MKADSSQVPPYVFPMLILSKRLHSIFMLRLFNDCFAVFFLFTSILCYQTGLRTAGSVMYSLGVGVKMSLLLALPAVGILLLQTLGPSGAFRRALLMVQLQVCTFYKARYGLLLTSIAFDSMAFCDKEFPELCLTGF